MSEFNDPSINAPASDITAPTQAPATLGAPAAPPATPVAPAAPPIGVPEAQVPSYRLREQREALERQHREAIATERQAWQQERAQMEARVRALAGFEPQANPEIETIRQQFKQVFPELFELSGRSKDLLGVLDKVGDFDNVTNQYWNNYIRSAVNKLESLAAETFGGPLNDEGKRVLISNFSGWVNSSPELRQRFENDPSTVEDYWRSYTSNFVDPIRRASTVQAAGRAQTSMGLPQDSPGGAPRATPTPKPTSLDERTDQAWASFKAMRNQG